ncbi:MAG: PHP domain-containing protein [Dehalococcoidia bacterium]|nr:PHP domain-containing protein [Dehalococcoidia bacterium]
MAVTDHNTIAGALRLRDSGAIRVIVGEEISTSDGELLGLFLTEPIPRGLSPLDTIARVKEQGGLVCIPHPLGRAPFPSTADMGHARDGRYIPSPRVTRANRLLTEAVLSQLDLMEVINCRTPFAQTWAATRRLASLCGLPLTAGSDAHTAGEIGHARVVMPDFSDAQTFLTAIRQAHLSGARSSVFVHMASMYAKLWRRGCSD